MAKSKNGQGQGTVFKRRDGYWCATISLGKENGRRKRRSFYGRTAEEVQQLLLSARADQAKGIVIDGEKQSVAEFLTSWLQNTARLSTRARTSERYAELIRLHVVPALGDVRLEKLTPQQVQQLLNAKSAAGTIAQDRPSHPRRPCYCTRTRLEMGAGTSQCRRPSRRAAGGPPSDSRLHLR